MATLVSILLAVALGCLPVFRFARLTALRPRWAGWLLIFGAGTAVGIALTSCLFFILLLVFPSAPHFALWVRLALLAAAAFACGRSRQPAAGPDRSMRHPYTPLYFPLLWVSFGVALLFVSPTA
jgi:hypothetical protein